MKSIRYINLDLATLESTRSNCLVFRHKLVRVEKGLRICTLQYNIRKMFYNINNRYPSTVSIINYGYIRFNFGLYV